MRGPSLVHRHLLRRGLVSWLLARLAFALALLMTMSSPLARGGLVGLGVIVLATVLALVDIQRVQERVLLANLGVNVPTLLGTLGAAALIGEITLVFLLS